MAFFSYVIHTFIPPIRTKVNSNSLQYITPKTSSVQSMFSLYNFISGVFKNNLKYIDKLSFVKGVSFHQSTLDV